MLYYKQRPYFYENSMKTKITLLIIFTVIITSSALYAVPENWDVYFGPKLGLGFGGTLTDVSLADLSPSTFGSTQTGPNRQGALIFQGAFAANFITPNNFGFELETGYRTGGETIPDASGNKYKLHLHYIDLAILGKYWFFGKLISAGLGVMGSVLLNAKLKGNGVSENITSGFRRFDFSLVFRMTYHYWAVSKKLLVAIEISILTGFVQQIEQTTTGRFYNVGIFASIGVFYLSKTKGINLRNFRY
jgi:hypothetical protein